MANKSASLKFTITYPDSDNASKAGSHTVATPFAAGAFLDAGLDVPEGTSADTEFEIPFGSIDSATGLYVENKTEKDVYLKINGHPGSVAGTLVLGTKTLALPAVVGERLSVEVVAANGTPGILSVRRDTGNVIVESWLAATGIEVLDLSDVKVWQGGSPQLFRLAPGGAIMVAMPAAPGGNPISSASVILAESVVLAGSIVCRVFGDPT